jgi:hypothetical protein
VGVGEVDLLAQSHLARARFGPRKSTAEPERTVTLCSLPTAGPGTSSRQSSVALGSGFCLTGSGH